VKGFSADGKVRVVCDNRGEVTGVTKRSVAESQPSKSGEQNYRKQRIQGSDIAPKQSQFLGL